MYINCLAVIFVCCLHDMEKTFSSKRFKLLGAAFFWNDHKGAHLGTYFQSVFLKLAKRIIWNRKEEVWKYPDLNWYVFEPF